MNQPRQPAGLPAGGQHGPVARNEPEVTLNRVASGFPHHGRETLPWVPTSGRGSEISEKDLNTRWRRDDGSVAALRELLATEGVTGKSADMFDDSGKVTYYLQQRKYLGDSSSSILQVSKATWDAVSDVPDSRSETERAPRGPPRTERAREGQALRQPGRLGQEPQVHPGPGPGTQAPRGRRSAARRREGRREGPVTTRPSGHRCVAEGPPHMCRP